METETGEQHNVITTTKDFEEDLNTDNEGLNIEEQQRRIWRTSRPYLPARFRAAEERIHQDRVNAQEQGYREWLVALENFKHHRVGDVHLPLQAGTLLVTSGVTREQYEAYGILRSYEKWYDECLVSFYQKYQADIRPLTDQELHDTWEALVDEVDKRTRENSVSQRFDRILEKRAEELMDEVQAGKLPRQDAAHLLKEYGQILKKKEYLKIQWEAHQKLMQFETENLSRMVTVWRLRDEKQGYPTFRKLSDFYYEVNTL